MTCFIASILNSSVYRLPLMVTSFELVYYALRCLAIRGRFNRAISTKYSILNTNCPLAKIVAYERSALGGRDRIGSNKYARYSGQPVVFILFCRHVDLYFHTAIILQVFFFQQRPSHKASIFVPSIYNIQMNTIAGDANTITPIHLDMMEKYF